MSTRKHFLASGAALAALVPAAVASAAPAASPAPTPSATPASPIIPKLAFALPAFDDALATRATHRHLFTSVKIDGGEVFGAMRGTLDAYNDMGIAESDVHPVAVLYHGIAIALGFDDVVWNRFFLPVLALPDQDGKMAAQKKDFDSVIDPKKKGNPCLHATGGDFDTSIESLIASAGAHFFLCNNATRGYATMIGHKLNLPPADVYAFMAAHLVPNAMLVPAGVWGVHAVQERHYTLLPTSL
jgi:hypothetical protein